MLTDRFDEALAYVNRIHRTQVRKGVAIPYVSHLLAVASLTLQHGGNEEQAIAALLHDAAEDRGGAAGGHKAPVRRRRGRDGRRLHRRLGRTEAAVARAQGGLCRGAGHKPARSLLVSLADKTHNAAAIVADLRECGEALWARFSGGREGSLYYRALATKRRRFTR
jgi:(p)ppGpp synthase/HD superfamily hydrolase